MEQDCGRAARIDSSGSARVRRHVPLTQTGRSDCRPCACHKAASFKRAWNHAGRRRRVGKWMYTHFVWWRYLQTFFSTQQSAQCKGGPKSIATTKFVFHWFHWSVCSTNWSMESYHVNEAGLFSRFEGRRSKRIRWYRILFRWPNLWRHQLLFVKLRRG